MCILLQCPYVLVVVMLILVQKEDMSRDPNERVDDKLMVNEKENKDRGELMPLLLVRLIFNFFEYTEEADDKIAAVGD